MAFEEYHKPDRTTPPRGPTCCGTRRMSALLEGAVSNDVVRLELERELTRCGASGASTRNEQSSALGVPRRTLLRWLVQYPFLRDLLGGAHALPRR